MKYVSIFPGGIVKQGIVRGALRYLDLENFAQSLTTNPELSAFWKSDGVRWEGMGVCEEEDQRFGPFHFITDDDDGFVWYNCPYRYDIDGEIVTIEQIVDDEMATFIINTLDYTYYYTGNGSWEPIK